MSDAVPGPEVAPPLWQRISTAPQLSDARRAESRLAEFLARSEDAELQNLAGRPNVRALLLALADHSPFLWRLATADIPRLGRCLASDPETVLAACLAACEKAEASAGSDAAIMRALRLAKQESALLIALADLGGAFDVIATTGALSRAADTFISVALRHVLREAGRAGRLRLADGDDIETGCGLVILALGKLGARELNYSSDVDIVVFFDPECASITGTVDPATLFSRLTKGIVRLLQERTPDGYVERVDLRLRPDPGSTAVAIALPTAYSYYESLGQNWERAAFIKARPVAGNKALGETFLANLMPFIWRKYFDYAAIADIAAMKRQIHASRGHGEIAVAGHDVKLGRGGIREIEFFVQTQQLIFGGKRPRLRGSRTLDMLEQLGNEGWVTQDAVADLRASYLFLREVEHRLQMVDDEQTQRLPSDEDTLGRFARFCGYAQKRRFCSEVTHRLRLVSHHYERLFEHSPRLDVAAGSLVFTGATEDPETLETLLRLGFKQAALAVETIRGWHFGRRHAVRGARAREILTELVPLLLQAFSRSGDPDAALAGLDAALAGMPAAAELFLVLKSNPPICELFGEILGGAPRLARTIISHPHVLDAAIDPDVLSALLDEDSFSQRASQILRHKFETEEFLDVLRDFAQEELFPIGLRLWSGMIEPSGAALAYSALAASIVETALAHVERDFSREHGTVPGGRLTVLALGKLGSREMTAASDLDLILIYDFDAARPESEGSRPLHAVQYYTRLAQRLISALTVATRRGRLYDVDMRLRPSGAALAYSALAASIVETALAHVERDFAREYGKVPGGRLTVLALGKLGSREMTAASDLDLILIYDFDAVQPESEGSRPLHAVQYYTRLAQRLISALTVATRRGRLYDVDMRLRPSGGKGPLATQFSSFADYQATEAETWEHMVLTRARPVAGDKALGVQTSNAIRAVLTRQRGDGLRKDVHDMRRLIAKEKGERDPWDLKLAAGGLIDIEFLAQYLLLRHAHAEPSLVCVSPLAVIEAAARLGKLDAEDARTVTSAYRLLTDVTQILRLTLDLGTSPREANEAVRRRLSRAAGEPDLSALESRLGDTRADVRAVFDEILLAR